MSKITPCLWFDGQAEEAMNFYLSIFPDGKKRSVSHADGKALLCEFELMGQTFQTLNGGPMFKFSEAISLSVDCTSQAEVDHYWNSLIAGGGAPSQCGWLKDKFGVSWQIVPDALGRLMSDPDRAKTGRVMQAMLQMQKIEIDKLQAAYDGR